VIGWLICWLVGWLVDWLITGFEVNSTALVIHGMNCELVIFEDGSHHRLHSDFLVFAFKGIWKIKNDIQES
jgi:hypothetical protein